MVHQKKKRKKKKNNFLKWKKSQAKIYKNLQKSKVNIITESTNLVTNYTTIN